MDRARLAKPCILQFLECLLEATCNSSSKGETFADLCLFVHHSTLPNRTAKGHSHPFRHSTGGCWWLAGDALRHVIPARWENDTCKVILDMQSETSKQCTDAEACTIRSLVHELEEEGLVDTSLHGHSLERPTSTADDNGALLIQWLCLRKPLCVHRCLIKVTVEYHHSNSLVWLRNRLLRGEADQPRYVYLYSRGWKPQVLFIGQCFHCRG